MKRITLLVVAILFVGSISAWADQVNFFLNLGTPSNVPGFITVTNEGFQAIFPLLNSAPFGSNLGSLPSSFIGGSFTAIGSGGTVTYSQPGPSSQCSTGCTETQASISGATVNILFNAPQGSTLAGTSGLVVAGTADGSETDFTYVNGAGEPDSLSVSMSGTFTINYVAPQFLADLGLQEPPDVWGGSGSYSASMQCPYCDTQSSPTYFASASVNGFGAAAPEPGTFVLVALGLSALGIALLRSKRTHPEPVA